MNAAKVAIPDRARLTLRETFADMRSLTSAWECVRRHVEVLAVNPCDPMRRPANYPRLWTDLSFLGLGQHQTTILGCLNGALFVFGVLALARRTMLKVGGVVV